ncbi:MAG: TonB-dependent receptor plug domain-containing protein [Algicola sp.]|nr:TonB-dependent receptor plug domain-containing protein [Algicola sp.]
MNISRKHGTNNIVKSHLNPHFKRSSLVCAISASLLAMSCLPAMAEDGQKASVYQAEFFAQYTPQNALEMVERLPGFSFDGGSNARGFGGNAGNVLIDGSRPTSKSGGLRGALVRIPAAQVERIEIIRGGAGGGEAAGQSIVANVIRSKSGTSGTWAMKIRQVDGANPEPNLEAAISTRLGEWDTSFDTDIGGNPGFRGATLENRDADGVLTSSSSEGLAERGRWAFFNGEGSTDIGEGKLTINGRFGGDHWRGDPKRTVFDNRMPDDSPADGFLEFNDRNIFKISELGVDWVTTGDDWKWRIIGLGQIEDVTYTSDLTSRDATGADTDKVHFGEDRTQSEYIIRTTFSSVGESTFKPEFGFEVANNELDTTGELVVNSEVIPLDNGTVVVEEQRGEAFATMVYQASPTLTIEGGLTAEFSQIQVSGDDNQKQNFMFYKPRLSATYQFDDENRFTLEAQRNVGQLNFRDFAASSDTQDASTTSGNSNLQPDKNTELKFTYDLSFSERGSLKVTAFHEWRSDVLEQIKLSDDPDSTSYGLGNAGEARFWGVITDLNLPLDAVLENGLLEFSHYYRGSSFDDSIIDGNRTISWYTPNWFKFKLRQDLTDLKLTWGMEYWAHFKDTGYRVNEVQTFGGNNRTRFFIETTRFFGVKTQLEINNINTAQYTRTRYIYGPDRGGALIRSERSARTRKPDIRLSVSGTF